MISLWNEAQQTWALQAVREAPVGVAPQHMMAVILITMIMFKWQYYYKGISTELSHWRYDTHTHTHTLSTVKIQNCLVNQLNTCPQLTPPALITPTLTLTSLLAAHTWSTTLLLGFTTREASRPHTGRVSRARHHSHHTPHRPCTVTTIPQQQQLIVAFEVSLIGYYYLAHGIYCITTCYSYCYSFK